MWGVGVRVKGDILMDGISGGETGARGGWVRRGRGSRDSIE